METNKAWVGRESRCGRFVSVALLAPVEGCMREELRRRIEVRKSDCLCASSGSFGSQMRANGRRKGEGNLVDDAQPCGRCSVDFLTTTLDVET